MIEIDLYMYSNDLKLVKIKLILLNLKQSKFIR